MKKKQKIKSLFKLSTITSLAFLLISSVGFAEEVTTTTTTITVDDSIKEDCSYFIIDEYDSTTGAKVYGNLIINITGGSFDNMTSDDYFNRSGVFVGSATTNNTITTGTLTINFDNSESAYLDTETNILNLIAGTMTAGSTNNAFVVTDGRYVNLTGGQIDGILVAGSISRGTSTYSTIGGNHIEISNTTIGSEVMSMYGIDTALYYTNANGLITSSVYGADAIANESSATVDYVDMYIGEGTVVNGFVFAGGSVYAGPASLVLGVTSYTDATKYTVQTAATYTTSVTISSDAEIAGGYVFAGMSALNLNSTALIYGDTYISIEGSALIEDSSGEGYVFGGSLMNESWSGRENGVTQYGSTYVSVTSSETENLNVYGGGFTMGDNTYFSNKSGSSSNSLSLAGISSTQTIDGDTNVSVGSSSIANTTVANVYGGGLTSANIYYYSDEILSSYIGDSEYADSTDTCYVYSEDATDGTEGALITIAASSTDATTLDGNYYGSGVLDQDGNLLYDGTNTLLVDASGNVISCDMISIITGDTNVTLTNTTVTGDVYAGGSIKEYDTTIEGVVVTDTVEGDGNVTLLGTVSVAGVVSGQGENGATVVGDSTLYVGTSAVEAKDAVEADLENDIAAQDAVEAQAEVVSTSTLNDLEDFDSVIISENSSLSVSGIISDVTSIIVAGTLDIESTSSDAKIYGTSSSGDVNISLATTETSSGSIYGLYDIDKDSSTSTIGGDLTIEVSNFEGAVYGIYTNTGNTTVGVGNNTSNSASVLADLTMEITDATLTNGILIYGAYSSIGGDLNLELNNVTVSYLTIMYNDGSSNLLAADLDNYYIGGSINLEITDGSLGGLVVAPSIYLTNNYSMWKYYSAETYTDGVYVGGDVNVTLGGNLVIGDESSKSTDEGINVAGGRGVSIDGNINLTITDGTYYELIYVGPNGGTVGTLLDANGNETDTYTSTSTVKEGTGDITVNISGGTFYGTIYTSSKCESSSVENALTNGSGVYDSDGVVVTSADYFSDLGYTQNADGNWSNGDGNVYYYDSTNSCWFNLSTGYDYVYGGMVLGDVELTISGGTFNSDIWVGAYNEDGNVSLDDDYIAGYDQGSYENVVLGSASATITGGTFTGTIYGGSAEGGTTLNFDGFSGSVGVADFDQVYVNNSSTLNVTGLIDSNVTVDSSSDLNVVVNSTNATTTAGDALVSNSSISGVSVVGIVIDNVYSILNTATTIYDETVETDASFALEGDWANYYADSNYEYAAVSYDEGILSVASDIYYSDNSGSSASVSTDVNGNLVVDVEEGSYTMASGTVSDSNVNKDSNSTGDLIIDGATLAVTSADNFSTITNSSVASSETGEIYVDSGTIDNSTNGVALSFDEAGYTLAEDKDLTISGGSVAGGEVSASDSSTLTLDNVTLTETLSIDGGTIAGSITYAGNSEDTTDTDAAIETKSESGEQSLADGLEINATGYTAITNAHDTTSEEESNGLNLVLKGTASVKGNIVANSPFTLTASSYTDTDGTTTAVESATLNLDGNLTTENAAGSTDSENITITGATLNITGDITAGAGDINITDGALNTSGSITTSGDINLAGSTLTLDSTASVDVSAINMTTDSEGKMSSISVSDSTVLASTDITISGSAAMLVNQVLTVSDSDVSSYVETDGTDVTVSVAYTAEAGTTATVESLSYFASQATGANASALASALDSIEASTSTDEIEAATENAALIAFKLQAETNGLDSYLIGSNSNIAEVDTMLLSNMNVANMNRARAILAKAEGTFDAETEVKVESEEVAEIKYSNVAQLQSINLLGSKDSANGAAGYDYWSVGATANFDKILSEKALVGASIGGVYSKTEGDAGDNANSTAFLLNAYGAYAMDKFEAFGNIGYTHFWNEGSKAGAGSADWDSDAFNFAVGVSYELAVSNIEGLTISPLAMFNIVFLEADSASYTNGVNVDDESYTSAKFMIGLEAEYAISAQFNAVIRAMYVCEMADTSYDTNYSVGGLLNGLSYIGSETGASSALIGLGLSYDFSETCSAYFDYNAYIYDNLTTHSLNLSVALKF